MLFRDLEVKYDDALIKEIERIINKSSLEDRVKSNMLNQLAELRRAKKTINYLLDGFNRQDRAISLLRFEKIELEKLVKRTRLACNNILNSISKKLNGPKSSISEEIDKFLKNDMEKDLNGFNN